MEEITQPEKKDSIKEFIEKAAPYIKKIIANWKNLLIINGIVAVVSAAFLLLFVKNYYDSTITILPNYGSINSSFSGSIASMLGVSIGESTPTEIYNNIIYSESVLKPVIYTKYKTEEFEKPVNLIEYYEIEPKVADEDSPEGFKERDKFLQVVEKFNGIILNSSVDRLTTIMTMNVRTKEASLSKDIINNLAKSLDEYVRVKRKSNAKEQRIYIEERVRQVKDSLTLVENKLKTFREQNRVVAHSPQLLLEQGRLQRTLEIQQTIFIELTKQLELIKLEEIKDAPIINIKEEAGLSINKAGPSRLKYLLIVMLISLSVSTIIILFREKIQFYVKEIKI